MLWTKIKRVAGGEGKYQWIYKYVNSGGVSQVHVQMVSGVDEDSDVKWISDGKLFVINGLGGRQVYWGLPSPSVGLTLPRCIRTLYCLPHFGHTGPWQRWRDGFFVAVGVCALQIYDWLTSTQWNYTQNTYGLDYYSVGHGTEGDQNLGDDEGRPQGKK